MDELIEKIKNIIDIEELKEMLRECISYDGSFDDLDYNENDEEFFEVMFSKTDDAVRAVCYGDYNYTDDLVKFNAYGNLETCSEFEFDELVEDQKDDIIQHFIELYEDGDADTSNDEVTELIDEYIEKNEDVED